MLLTRPWEPVGEHQEESLQQIGKSLNQHFIVHLWSNLIWLFQGGGAGHGGQQLGVAGGANFVPASLGDKVNDVLSEVQDIKSKQEDMDGKWETMKKENEALWREVVGLRWVLAYLNH